LYISFPSPYGEGRQSFQIEKNVEGVRLRNDLKNSKLDNSL